MSKNWYPVINYELCTECGTCIEKCAHGVFKLGSQRPVVVNPEGCIEGCRGCGNLCPAGAIDYVGNGGGANGCGCSCGGCCS
jgi:NAD-dependent dihydropyrimidine dehydrogenase PreA subunit